MAGFVFSGFSLLGYGVFCFGRWVDTTIEERAGIPSLCRVPFPGKMSHACFDCRGQQSGLPFQMRYGR